MERKKIFEENKKGRRKKSSRKIKWKKERKNKIAGNRK